MLNIFVSYEFERLCEHKCNYLDQRARVDVTSVWTLCGLCMDSVGFRVDSVGLRVDSVGLRVDSVGLCVDSVGLRGTP